MLELEIKSTIDGSIEPSLFIEADTTNGPRPLVVGLHTWSMTRHDVDSSMLEWAKKHNRHLLLPEFRGANVPTNPRCKQACGSKLAKQDIIDAVEYVKANYKVDTDNILLIGGSGGGHMALLMAAYAPYLWRAVASFVPVVSLFDWYREKLNNPVGGKYAKDMAACCGGTPEEAAEEYSFRSPSCYAAEIAKSNTTIFTGKFDHSIPSHQTLDLYNNIFSNYPESRVFLHMFDGGHEMRLDLAEMWFSSQINARKLSALGN